MGNAYRSVLALKPTGDAIPANVLSGKTFSNADGVGKTGTMVNNGAVSVTLTDQAPTYTIPEGYHNGLGVVGFTSSGGDGANLIVTCDSRFAGTTITCTDGTTTFEEICPSTSPYQVVFQSIPIGTWTISGTYSGQTYSTIFTVLNFEATLNSIPDGSTATPTDDIQIWLHCANIWDKTYTSLSEVLADSSTLQAVIASNNAADYMARSTTWASSVSADSSAMSYIGLDDYCSDALLANSTWLEAICSSTYFESVLNVKVPTMTSDTTPSGKSSASSTMSSNYEPWRAFDNSSGTYWVGGADTNYRLMYMFQSPTKINKMNIETNTQSGRSFTNPIIQGSNDGVNWTDIKQLTGYSSTSSPYTNDFINNTAYQYYCIYISKTGTVDTSPSISTLQFYGRE